MNNDYMIFVYQTKNMVNGKTYVGIRKTDRLNDGYIGCGIKCQADAERMCNKGISYPFPRAVKKYGYDNFSREILCFFDTYDEALEEERFIVNEDWVNSDENYNVAIGGSVIKLTGEAEQRRIRNLSKAVKKSNSKIWIVVYEDGRTERVTNLSEFAHKNGYNRSLGKSYSFFNGAWACPEEDYKNGLRPRDRKIVHTTNWSIKRPDGSIVTTDNLRAFCKEEGISDCAAYTAVNKKRDYIGYNFVKVKTRN